MQLAPGTIVDNKFRITARLGDGGMGTVFSAEQIELNRNVDLTCNLFIKLESTKEPETRKCVYQSFPRLLKSVGMGQIQSAV